METPLKLGVWDVETALKLGVWDVDTPPKLAVWDVLIAAQPAVWSVSISPQIKDCPRAPVICKPSGEAFAEAATVVSPNADVISCPVSSASDRSVGVSAYRRNAKSGCDCEPGYGCVGVSTDGDRAKARCNCEPGYGNIGCRRY